MGVKAGTGNGKGAIGEERRGTKSVTETCRVNFLSIAYTVVSGTHELLDTQKAYEASSLAIWFP